MNDDKCLEEEIIKNKLLFRGRLGGKNSNELSLITNMLTGESELEVTLNIKIRVATTRLGRAKRLWGAVGNYSEYAEHKLQSILDPKVGDDYELTAEGLKADD